MATRKAVKTGGPTTRGDKTRTRSKLTKAEREARDKARGGEQARPPRPNVARRNAARKAARLRPDGTPPRCKGTNLRGDPCGAPPLRAGTEIDGITVSGDWCLRHDADLPDDAWRRFIQEPGSRAAAESRSKLRRPIEILADALEHAPALMFEPYFKALGLEMDPETGRLVKISGGAKIVGFSREGVARVSKIDDVDLQMRAAEKLQDRVWGKPKVALDVAGSGTAAAVVIPNDPERNHNVAKVLIECGALKPDGDVDPPIE